MSWTLRRHIGTLGILLLQNSLQVRPSALRGVCRHFFLVLVKAVGTVGGETSKVRDEH